MSDDETLTHVKRLLGLLNGVELAWSQRTPTNIRLGLAIRDPRSLALLAHVTGAANVPLHVETHWRCHEVHDDPNCMRYDLRVPLESTPCDPPSNLQLVGGMLARQLKERGLLGPGEADELLRAWHFAID